VRPGRTDNKSVGDCACTSVGKFFFFENCFNFEYEIRRGIHAFDARVWRGEVVSLGGLKNRRLLQREERLRHGGHRILGETRGGEAPEGVSGPRHRLHPGQTQEGRRRAQQNRQTLLRRGKLITLIRRHV
jgi:hypothetical protein